MRIVVLAGGISTEREVSLSSGAMVCRALREAGHQAILVDAFLGVEDLPAHPEDAFLVKEDPKIVRVEQTAPDLAAVRASRPDSGLGDLGKHVIELCQAADIVYMGLHGADGENGRMQALFDVMGIKYTGAGYLGSALAMDKGITKHLFLQSGVRTPRGRVFAREDDLSQAAAFGFPCVVKPCVGGSSIGVSIPQNQEELDAALRDVFADEREVLVEEYIEGREFSCGILGGEALPLIEIIPRDGFYDYAHKYQPGWTEEVTPADLPEEPTRAMQALACKAFAALKLEVYARADFLLDAKGDAYCLELNTLPGMTPTSLLPQEAAVVGIDYTALCEKVIALSLEKY